MQFNSLFTRHLATLSNIMKKSSNSSKLKSSIESIGSIISSHSDQMKSHVLHVQATRNNTIASLVDHTGKTIYTCSAGFCGLKKANRGTTDAGFVTVSELIRKVKEKKIVISNGIHIKLKGFGPGRNNAFRAICSSGWPITRVSDVTSIRFKGCRPPKQRRL